MLKIFVLFIGLVVNFFAGSQANAVKFKCPSGQFFATFKAIPEPTCRSQVGLLYNGEGRCLTEDSIDKLPRVPGLSRIRLGSFAGCLKEYPGRIGGNNIVSIETDLTQENGRTIYE